MEPLRHTIFFTLVTTLFLCAAGTASAQPSRILTDQTGRKVTVPAHPSRIIALAPSAMEIVCALGGRDRLVGRTRFSDHPPEAVDLPVVGSYVQLDVEKIASLRPDLCIALKDGTPYVTVQTLRRLHIPVFAVNNDSLDSVIQAIGLVGQVINRPREAAEVMASLTHRIKKVQERIACAPTRPGVLYQIDSNPIITAGQGTYINELITLAGGRNVAAAFTGYPRFSMEQALTLMPEVIIIPSMDRSGAWKETAATWQQWTHIPAVRQHRIQQVNSDLFDRPSPRMVDGLEILARILHPECFEKSADSTQMTGNKK
ncbi:ABC transporter substrate-binding protein [Desulfoplanes formicivorans]|uniref:ABC transporter substrate-binding protein n=1 Tax=Desulfoplanes formicivorans TaxID=1592317 RepID=A0A194AJ28_9BACT|nr:cobalamin-binding protein [Desulfoplanes formicivorans]GAU08749.1 ABC transporter substrate-binding protein [Desulfoplanes formicivorans]